MDSELRVVSLISGHFILLLNTVSSITRIAPSLIPPVHIQMML